ncbi:hypothetical protein FHT85_005204 [Rhizobium sp. BK312]|uniref:hypothetical protein n=1 Tax=Rhizobium sp. BK312 TaxID=2587080 RepID=UPI000DD93077|nr:hypothetical protein [Rhizobium sp. BK312]MBB3428183.1 hypothetical protein [Rhizobium sp. BK312]
MLETFWTLLQIAPTQDEDEIRRAYARRLRDFRPDEDPQGFQRLVGARDAALAWASARALQPIMLHAFDAHNELLEAVDLLSDRNDLVERSMVEPTDVTAAPTDLPPSDEDPVSASNNRPSEEAPREQSIDMAPELRISKPDLDKLVFDRLSEIIAQGEQRPWSVDPSAQETQRWEELFNLASANLSLQRHEEFLEAVGRHVASMLPRSTLQSPDTVSEFGQGHSFAAVVETVEQQCRFAERPATLVRLCGQNDAMVYFSWLAHAQVARGILRRREAGHTAYFDEKTGLPIFPTEDREIALQTVELAKFFNRAVERKRWPFHLEWKSLMLPATQLASAGLIWQSGIFFGLLILSTAGGFSPTSNIVQWIGLVCVLVLLAARIVLPVYMQRLAVDAAVQRVIDADRRGLWNKVTRSNSLRNFWRDYEKVTSTIEVLLSVMALISVLNTLTFMAQTKDDPGKPVEAVVSEIVGSAIDAVASDDKLADGQLFDLMKFLITVEQTGFRDRKNDTGRLLADLEDGQWLRDLHSRADQLISPRWFKESNQPLVRPLMATPAAARESKLRTLAAAYRSGTPQQRMEIERSLLAWAPLLQDANDPQAIAAIWAAIPPQTSGPNLDAFPDTMRGLLLDSFLKHSVTDSRFNDLQLIVEFNRLLTVPDEKLRDMSPVVEADTSGGAVSGDDPSRIEIKTDGASSNAIEQSITDDGAVARYLRQNLYRSPTTAPRLYEASRTEVAIARMAYFNIARTCLDFNSAALRSNMRRFLAHSLADTLAPEPSTNAELWRTLGQRALAEPMCYRKVFANGPGEKQIDDLFNAPNKQLEGFFKADLSTGEREYLEDFLEFMPKDNSIYGFTRNKLASLAHGLLGNWYYHNGDNRNAILEFDQALAGGTQCGEFHMRRGQALEALGDHKRGRADLQLAAQPSTRWCVTDPMSIVELQLAIKPLLEK